MLYTTYLDEKLSKTEGHFSIIGEDYFEFELLHDKQSEQVLIERAVKTTTQILYDKGLFNNYIYNNAVEILKDYLLIEVEERRRPDLEEVKDIIQ